jgi:hypothetical protein
VRIIVRRREERRCHGGMVIALAGLAQQALFVVGGKVVVRL